jgi:hypothetical protein
MTPKVSRIFLLPRSHFQPMVISQLNRKSQFLTDAASSHCNLKVTPGQQASYTYLNLSIAHRLCIILMHKEGLLHPGHSHSGLHPRNSALVGQLLILLE